MYNCDRAERLTTQNFGREFVSPAWYYVADNDRGSHKQSRVPFLTSGVRITGDSGGGGRSDAKISPAEYYPLYRKRRVTLGTSLGYTATRDLEPLPVHLRRAEKFAGAERPRRIGFVDNQYFPDVTAFCDLFKYYCQGGISKKAQRPCVSAAKVKWQTPKTFPRHPLTSLIRVTKIGPNERTAADDAVPRLPTAMPKVVKNPKTKQSAVPGPGPGSYNLTSTFDHKSATCMPHGNSHGAKSLPRYLDALVANARRENIPGPGMYTGPKSSFDAIPAKPPIRVIRKTNNTPRKTAVDNGLAPNFYDVKYELVQTSSPRWSMKGSKRAAAKNDNNNFSVGPATHVVRNGGGISRTTDGRDSSATEQQLVPTRVSLQCRTTAAAGRMCGRRTAPRCSRKV